MGQLPAGSITLSRTPQQAEQVEVDDPLNGSPTSPRPPCRSTIRRRSSRSCSAAFPKRSTGPRRKTSATPRPTASRRSRRSPSSCDALLVVGAPNSSNSARLVEVAHKLGCDRGHAGAAGGRCRLGRSTASARLGITAGASAPEILVEEVIDACRRALRGDHRGDHGHARSTQFKLPKGPSSCRES